MYLVPKIGTQRILILPKGENLKTSLRRYPKYYQNYINKVQNIPNEDCYTSITEEDQKSTKFAENISMVYNSLSNISLQLNVKFHWLVDIGAIFYMILHHYWLKLYSLYKRAI